MVATPYRVAALGPRRSVLDDASAGWVRREMGRVVTRQTHRHAPLLAVASLAPGVGLLWAEAALTAGVELEVWLPHPAVLDPWPELTRRRLLAAIQAAKRLVVPFGRSPAFEPWMFGAHLTAMTETVHAQVAVWNGDLSEYYYAVTDHGACPFHWLNFQSRRSSWHPAGRPRA